MSVNINGKQFAVCVCVHARVRAARMCGIFIYCFFYCVYVGLTEFIIFMSKTSVATILSCGVMATNNNVYSSCHM